MCEIPPGSNANISKQNELIIRNNYFNISKQNELVIRNNYLNISKQISNYINHFFI